MPLTGEYEPSASAWAREQAELIESSNGSEGTVMRGMPVIVLTTLGVKSGKIRKTPLMRVEHDGEYLIVASKGGSAEDPTWSRNVLSSPFVELQDGPVRKDYQARELAGDERAIWWDRAVEAFPDYANYQVKTERLIPVYLLTPIE